MRSSLRINQRRRAKTGSALIGWLEEGKWHFDPHGPDGRYFRSGNARRFVADHATYLDGLLDR